jgi:glycosyltransferase involved in cell wall biosynthesis
VKLLLWYWGRRGGGARYTLGLARAFAPQCDLSLSLSRGSELFAETAALAPGFPVDTYSGLLSAALATARIPALRHDFARYIKSAGIDVVVSSMQHMWTPFFLAPIKKAGAKLIVTVHDAAPHPGDTTIGWDMTMRSQMEAADGVLALSGHVADALTARYGVPRAQIATVSLPAFDFGAAQTARAFPAGRPVRLLFFGRIKPYKGIDLMLDAVRLLERTHDVTLTIAGQGDLSLYAEKIAALKSVNIVNRWIAEDEVGALLTAHDVLLASYAEASQSGVIPSAYGAGLPVVASGVGGLCEQVDDGVTGMLAKESTPEAYAQAIARLIGDRAVYAACSAGAVRAAQGKFGWGAIAAAYLAMARDVSAKSVS